MVVGCGIVPLSSSLCFVFVYFLHFLFSSLYFLLFCLLLDKLNRLSSSVNSMELLFMCIHGKTVSYVIPSTGETFLKKGVVEKNKQRTRCVGGKKKKRVSLRVIFCGGRIKHYEKKLVAFPTIASAALSLRFPLHSVFSYSETEASRCFMSPLIEKSGSK